MSLRDIAADATCDPTPGGATRNPVNSLASQMLDTHGREGEAREARDMRGAAQVANPANTHSHSDLIPDDTHVFSGEGDEASFEQFIASMKNSSLDATGDGSGLDFEMPQDVDFSNMFWGDVNNQEVARQSFQFVETNAFIGQEGAFDEGLKLFQQGLLHDAMMAFEGALQGPEVKTPTERSDVWRWLGTAHAENDDDTKAISCLLHSLEEDPQNIEALLDLGVSYTNELMQGQALTYLRQWLLQHPEYSMIPGEFDAVGTLSPQIVIDMFRRASMIARDDPDLFAVLGVLYNLTRQYDSAQRAFDTALKLDANNYSLWNKRGASQANSPEADGSSRAINFYRRAVELKPNYVRAWVNLGIAYSNLAKYDTSAKYYLHALSLNQECDHIWSYLRASFSAMQRDDLAEMVSQRDLNLFRAEFKF